MSSAATDRDPLPPVKAWLAEDHEGHVMTLVEDGSFVEWIRMVVDRYERLIVAAESVEKTLDDYLHLGLAPSREMWYAERDALRAALR